MNYQEEQENCLGGGRYCAPDPDGVGGLDGRDVLYEDIRQICMNLYYPSFYFDYMAKFQEKCLLVKEGSSKLTSDKLKDCSYDLAENVVGYSVRERLTRCFDESFKERVTEGNKFKVENTMLQDQLGKFKDKGITVWPTVRVNGVTFKGTMEAKAVFAAICSGFTNPPSECSGRTELYPFDRPQHSWFRSFFGIVGSLVVLMTIFFFVYRRYVRGAMIQEMNDQINAAVSSYYKMGDGRNVNKDNI